MSPVSLTCQRPAVYRALAEKFETFPPKTQDSSYADLLLAFNNAGVVVPMGEELDSPSMSIHICIDAKNAWRIIQDIIRLHHFLHPSSTYYSRSRRRKEEFVPVSKLSTFDWTSIFDPPYLNYLDALDSLIPFSALTSVPSKRKLGPKPNTASRRQKKAHTASKTAKTPNAPDTDAISVGVFAAGPSAGAGSQHTVSSSALDHATLSRGTSRKTPSTSPRTSDQPSTTYDSDSSDVVVLSGPPQPSPSRSSSSGYTGKGKGKQRA